MDPNQLRERVRATLRHFAYDQEHVRGWYYHFVNRKSGARVWNSELSTIDTALLLAGVLTAQQYYRDDAEIFDLASAVYKTGRLYVDAGQANGPAAHGLASGNRPDAR